MRTSCVLTVTLLLVGCSGTATQPDTPSAATQPATASTSSPTPELLQESGIAYASVHGPDWLPPVLDVYAPPVANGLPLVVLFHGAGIGIDRRSLQYPYLAEAIAGEGAVVVLANWGQTGMPWDRSIWQAVHDESQMRDEGACAVSYAVTHAAEWGADPTRLVLFGHSGGAIEAGRAALMATSPFPGCAVPPASWTVRGLLLWDGDFLLANPGFHAFRRDLPRLLEVMTPWPSLDTAPDVARVEFVVSRNSRDGLSTQDASKDAEWLTWRDPTGKMQELLDRLGAFRDGWLDVGEEAEAMVVGLKARGIHARLMVLTDPSTTHEFLSEPDFDRMVEEVLSLARG